MNPVRRRRALAAGALASLTLGAFASNHREAPITALDTKADITDVFAFVSYDGGQAAGLTPEKVTLIMCVDPFLEPGNGPTLFPFDPGIRYEFYIDNDQDGLPNRAVRVGFQTEYRLPDLYTAVAGIGDSGAFAPGTNQLVVPPQIRGFQDIGLNQRQSYQIEFVDLDARQATDLANPDGSPFFAVPGNAGPRTMDYEALFAQGTYALPNGMSVFAGTVDDPFFLDLGATFDTANYRTLGSGVPAVLTAFEDSADFNFVSDTFSGFAVNAIAIEIPIEMLTSTGLVEPPSSPAAVLGVYASTARRRQTIRRSPLPSQDVGPWRRVQRKGNPLINELLVGIGSKDRFSMDAPVNDDQFANFFFDPPIVRVVEALYGGALSVPSAPRNDLAPLVTYTFPAGISPGPIADLLRINTGIPATPPDQASRLGLIDGDAGGFPNGRRVFDDVVDITLRVAVGGVLDPTFPGFTPGINDRLGDGVNVNDAPFRTSFPYLASAPDGRNRRHVDPGEAGGGPVD